MITPQPIPRSCWVAQMMMLTWVVRLLYSWLCVHAWLTLFISRMPALVTLGVRLVLVLHWVSVCHWTAMSLCCSVVWCCDAFAYGSSCAHWLCCWLHCLCTFIVCTAFCFHFSHHPPFLKLEESDMVRIFSYYQCLGLQPVLHLCIEMGTFPLPGGILEYW